MTDASYIQLGKRYQYHPSQIVQVPFGMAQADRRSHLYVIGKTGMGKTRLIQSMIEQDMALGHAVGLIDPHGDLAWEILDAIPPERRQDVVLVDPTDSAWPVSLNLLHAAPQPSAVASGLVEAFEGYFGSSWGPRLAWQLFCGLYSLASAQNTSLLGLQRLFVDASYRQQIVHQVTDPVIRSFWREEFETWDDRFRREAIAPMQNKVGQLFGSPALRNILGQVTGRIDLRRVMDGGIFIARLPKGPLGADKASLFGSLLVSLFQLAAVQRDDTPEEERRDFHLYIEEFQNFMTAGIASALSEVRKYRLDLTLVNQYTKSLREDVRDAVFGNVGSMIAFRVGNHDATLLEQEYAPDVPATQFLNLGRRQMWVHLQEQGGPSVPFQAETLTFTPTTYGQRDVVIQASRQRYARPRAEVEEKITRFLAPKNPPVRRESVRRESVKVPTRARSKKAGAVALNERPEGEHTRSVRLSPSARERPPQGEGDRQGHATVS